MNLLSVLGIDLKLFIAQLLNFVLLLFILYKIGYKPMLAFIHERKRTIAKGLDDAKNAEQAYKDARHQQTEVIVRARKEAQAILDEAKKHAEQHRITALDKTKKEMQKLVEQSKASIVAEREKMMKDLKDEVINMVIASTTKVLHGAVDEQVDRSWLKTQLAKVRK